MPIRELIDDAEAEARSALAKSLGKHALLAEKVFNRIGQALEAAPEVAIRDVALSRRVLTILLVRLSNDIRCAGQAALSGYPIQAGTLVSSVYEIAYCVAFIGNNDAVAQEWVAHDDPTRIFRPIASLTRGVLSAAAVGDIERQFGIEYRVYRQLCLAKHANPLLQKEHGHHIEPEYVVAMNGPDTSEESVRLARFSLEHAARLGLLALAAFANVHVPPTAREPLVRQTESLMSEFRQLARESIQMYGNDDPFPGKW